MGFNYTYNTISYNELLSTIFPNIVHSLHAPNSVRVNKPGKLASRSKCELQRPLIKMFFFFQNGHIVMHLSVNKQQNRA